MGDWERLSPRNQRRRQQQNQQQGGGFHHYGGRGGGGRPARCASTFGRPPPSGCWKPTVPSWEKKFCFHVGSIPWRKLLESKTMMSFHKSVAQWDDSACEEVFHNAKARYWAQINGLPCDIPLPDPDMYIDEIDWNAKTDPQLVLDLEKRTSPPPSDEEGKKSSFLTSGWDSFFAPHEEIPHNGWVHAAHDDPAITSGWGDVNKKEVTDCNYGWGPKAGWGDRVPEDNTWDRNNSWNRWGYNDRQVTSGWEGWGDGDKKEDSGCNTGWGPKAGWGDRVPEDNSWDRNNSWNQWGNSSWRHKDRSCGQWENSKNDADCYYSEPRRYGKKRDGNAGGWYGQRDVNLRHKDGDNYRISNNNSSSYCRERRRINDALRTYT